MKIDLNEPFDFTFNVYLGCTDADGADGIVFIMQPGNIEDCQWHLIRIGWNPATKWMGSYFDGKLRVEANIDLIKDVFQNDPMVCWGFSAATGGSSNLQKCSSMKQLLMPARIRLH